MVAVLAVGSTRCFPAPPRPFSGMFGLCHVTQEPQELSRLGVCPDHTAPKSTAVLGAGWGFWMLITFLGAS